MYATHRYDDDLRIVVEAKGRSKFPYRKTIDFKGELINERQRGLLNHRKKPGSPIIDHEIEGWLRPEDAAKLYEMAYFCNGDIAELGTSRGLSSFVMAQAIRDSGATGIVYTVDLRQDCCDAANKRLSNRNVPNVVIECNEGAAWLRTWIGKGKKFRFAFIDHAHQYEPVREACSLIHQVLEPGSFVAFHDFCDSRNFKEEEVDFGVFRGVIDGLSSSFEFYGAFGCLSVYRYPG